MTSSKQPIPSPVDTVESDAVDTRRLAQTMPRIRDSIDTQEYLLRQETETVDGSIPTLRLQLPDGNIVTYNNQPFIVVGRYDASQTKNPILDSTPYNGFKLGVSRVHGVFEVEDDHYVYRDLSSTNGTKWNDEPLVPHLATKLKAGDELQLGEFLIIVK